MAGSGLSQRQRRRQQRQRRQLLEKLQASSRRFAHLMGTLVAKYNQPFEEDPLVHLATLTYPTPAGLREWGGKRVTQRIFQNIQTSLEKEVCSIDNIMQSTFTDVKGKSNDDSVLKKMELSDLPIVTQNDSLQSLPVSDLDEKYMARVDVILEDEHPKLIEVDSLSTKQQQPHPMILSSKKRPQAFLDHSTNGSWKTDGIPDHPTSTLQGPQDTQVSLYQSSISWRAKGNRSSQSLSVTTCEDEESTQDLTLSDIYADMLYSLYKCLPSQKIGLVSTSKYISKSWFPKKRRLNITFTMEKSFLKMNEKFQIISGEKNSLIYRKDFKWNDLTYSEPNSIAKNSELLPCFPSVSSPSSALSGALHHLSIQESPSRTMDGRQAAPSPSRAALSGALHNLSIQESPSRTMVRRWAAPSPSQSPVRSQSPSALSLCLPPNQTSAKERFCPLKQSSPEADASRQERSLSRSTRMPRLPQTSKNAPLSRERLCQELSASAPSEVCARTGFPRKKETAARKALPFGMEQTPCKDQDAIDAMFDTYSQETTQWAQELLSLRKSGQKSKMLTASKCGDSLDSFDPWDGLQKAAFPQGMARNSLCETGTTVRCTAVLRTTLKEDFSSPTKRRKVSNSQPWDPFNSSKMRDKA